MTKPDPTEPQESNLVPTLEPDPDPDRFFDRTSPGAHEWWYFDAISHDGRDALVIVFYAGLPFDPSYGVATLRHLKNPSKNPQPRALDHSAIGFSWYRDGKPIVYALNGYRADRFQHQANPFAVEVGGSRVDRDGTGYKLTIATPTVTAQAIRAEVRFRPADSTEPFGRDLGTATAPHNWILVAPDCQVEGTASIGSENRNLTFKGRGYHDHNAGAEDLSVAMTRWAWGRWHHESRTEVYYVSEPRQGPSQSLWITCVDGRPESIREDVTLTGVGGKAGNVFGIRHDHCLLLEQGDQHLFQGAGACVDDGPFYRRWVLPFSKTQTGPDPLKSDQLGIAELLVTRNLHKFWFNWMIPYRLKWPRV